MGNSVVQAKIDSIPAISQESSFSELMNLRYQSPQRALDLLEEMATTSLTEEDIATAIQALVGMVQICGHQANYKASYDRLWTALLLADAAKMKLQRASIYRSIGRCYRFFDTLLQQFPKLPQGDLKLCALIKLNFSSKEMAKLLGMSVESVHTTRSRLRKKLQLARDMNLKEFIANI